jgi:hypothetical protein
MRKYRVSFEPLGSHARELLSYAIEQDFSRADFDNEEVWFCCTVFDGLFPAVVIAFEFKSPHDPHLSVACADPRGLSRQLLTTIYQTIFSRADRVTALVEPSNARALGQIWRMGFRPEGYLRRGLGGSKDAAIFGLIPEECPYLRGEPFRIRIIKPTHDTHMGVQ